MPSEPPAFLDATWGSGGILEIRYREASVLAEEMADDTIRWLDALVARSPGGLSILVDAANVKDATAGYRAKMGPWFRANASRVRLAIFNLRPFVRVMALLFSIATTLPVKFAASREEAIRWLDPLPAR